MLNVVAGLAANMAASPLADVLGKLTTAAAGTVGVAAPVLPCGISMGEIASVAAYGTLLLGSTFVQVCQGKKADDSETRRIARVEAAITKLSTKQDEALGDLADLAIEQQWVREAIESPLGGVPGSFDAAWRGQVEEGLKALGAEAALIRQTLDDMRVVAFDTNARVRGLEVAADRHDDKLDEVLSENQLMRLAIQSLGEQMASMHSSRGLEAENSKLTAELAAVTERYLAAERALGRPWRAVIEELRGDPKKLGTFLDKETERDEIELIEKHRERAAVWHLTGEIDKAVNSLKKILVLSPDDRLALTRLGHVNVLLAHYDEAKRLFQRVAELATDEQWRALSVGNLGLIDLSRGNLEAAEECFKHALAIYEKLGITEGVAISWGLLGNVELTRENLDASEQCFKKSLHAYELIGESRGIAAQCGHLGVVAWRQDNLDLADQYIKRSLALSEKLHDVTSMANQLGNLGLVERNRGNLSAAEGYHKKSLDINTKLGRRAHVAIDHSHLGRVEQFRGNLDSAYGYFRTSLGINEELGRLEGLAKDYGHLGNISMLRGHFDEADRLWRRSRELFANLDAKGCYG